MQHCSAILPITDFATACLLLFYACQCASATFQDKHNAKASWFNEGPDRLGAQDEAVTWGSLETVSAVYR